MEIRGCHGNVVHAVVTETFRYRSGRTAFDGLQVPRAIEKKEVPAERLVVVQPRLGGKLVGVTVGFGIAPFPVADPVGIVVDKHRMPRRIEHVAALFGTTVRKLCRQAELSVDVPVHFEILRKSGVCRPVFGVERSVVQRVIHRIIVVGTLLPQQFFQLAVAVVRGEIRLQSDVFTEQPVGRFVGNVARIVHLVPEYYVLVSIGKRVVDVEGAAVRAFHDALHVVVRSTEDVTNAFVAAF